MTMICRITDETINSPWDETEDEAHVLRSIDEITFADLMAEDLTIWMGKNAQFGFDLEIENQKGETIVSNKKIHPFAIDSFAQLCRGFLHFYDKVTDKEVM